MKNILDTKISAKGLAAALITVAMFLFGTIVILPKLANWWQMVSTNAMFSNHPVFSGLRYFDTGLIIWLFVAPLIYWLSVKLPLKNDRSLLLTLFGHFILGGVLTYLHHVVYRSLLLNSGSFVETGVWWDVFTIRPSTITPSFFYFFILIACWLWQHYDRKRVAEVTEAREDSDLKRAELAEIKMKLQPHFLFNALHTVSVYAMKGDNENVVKLIEKLGNLLRISLEEKQEGFVSLKEELSYLDEYLSFEEIRFGDNLRIERSIDIAAQDAQIPTLLLQPIVENAIKHGVSKREGGGFIRISVLKQDKQIWIAIRDNGPGFSEREDSGLGLTLTNDRLKLLFNDNYSLIRKNIDPAGAEVEIRMPFITEEE